MYTVGMVINWLKLESVETSNIFHFCFTGLIPNCSTVQVMLYQVSYGASLLCQKSHTYGTGYVTQTSKCISLQILHYGKSLFEVIT